MRNKPNVYIDDTKVLGAIVVLENYIDGALADYEDGQVENTTCLEDSIYVHRVLEFIATHGFSLWAGDEYQERFDKVHLVEDKNDKEVH